MNDKGKDIADYDTNISLNIPPKTIIAYGVIELEVSNTGHFGIDAVMIAEMYYCVKILT